MSSSETLRIVILREDGVLVAQCLEYDICTQAKDLDTLKDRMNCLIDLELAEGQPIDQAPKRFHKMWDQAFLRAEGNREYGLMAA